MTINRSRGFTLIELLVVIAIIGILSAVVLASLSTARNKGNDAAVQSNLSTIQTQAEIYYGGAGSNSYSSPTGAAITSCTGGMFSDTTVANAINSAKNSARGGLIACGVTANGTAYAVEAAVNGTTTGQSWCVDSTGNAKYEPVATPATLTQCL